MNNFLVLANSALHNLCHFKKVYVVLGNQSCDLDSAISALVYAYYLHSLYTSDSNTTVIPVLNIQEDEFPFRTETIYFLKKLNLDTTNIICRNHLNLKQLSEENKLQLVLVDHHVLPAHDKHLEKSVVEVLDHRPQDKSVNWDNISSVINTAGSCATLVANIILDKNIKALDNTTAKLLHGTIVLDTINFNTTAKRYTQQDLDVVSKLEKSFKIDFSREEIYNELTSARSDVSSLTPFQILHRDMKIISGVPFPGVPMLITEFLKLPGAVESFRKFCESKRCKVIVPMGLVTKNNKVFREIGVYCFQECELEKSLVSYLKNSSELNLTEIEENINGLTLFSQANLKATRKHIVPMLNPIITNCKTGNSL